MAFIQNTTLRNLYTDKKPEHFETLKKSKARYLHKYYQNLKVWNEKKFVIMKGKEKSENL